MMCGNTKKASILLVRKLYTLMQILGPLPDNVCLNMKLGYYDEGNLQSTTASRRIDRTLIYSASMKLSSNVSLDINTHKHMHGQYCTYVDNILHMQ